MFLIENIEELTPEKIAKIIQVFVGTDLVKLQRYGDYYDGKQDIMRKFNEDPTKPCNRIVTNYCYNIVENYQGYLTGIDVTYSSESDISAIQDILNYNDVRTEDNEFLRNALIYGVAYEINYVDEDAKQRFKVLDSKECIPVYDNTLNQNLLALVRFYPKDPLDMTRGYKVEVYDSQKCDTYETDTGISGLRLIETNPHFYHQVPATIFSLNTKEKSCFDEIMTLQDAYNKLLSDEVDDFEAFCDAYLVLSGVDIPGETEEEMNESVRMLKTNRVIVIPRPSSTTGSSGPLGTAEFLNKQISDTQIENMLSNINDQIHKIAASPDFTDDAFGTASGIAMKYKLLGFENKASSIVANMTKALQKRIELICEVLGMVEGEAMWRDVEITFTRNLPIDLAETANTVNAFRGLVSDATLLSMLPFVSDVEKELALVKEQEQEKQALYGFGTEVNRDESTVLDEED